MLKRYDLIFNFVNGKSIKIQRDFVIDENDIIDWIKELYEYSYFWSIDDNIFFNMDKVTYIQYFEVKDGNRKQISDIQDK